jgi:hypothetical protein
MKITFMDIDGNTVEKNIVDINSIEDVKESFNELKKKKKGKK